MDFFESKYSKIRCGTCKYWGNGYERRKNAKYRTCQNKKSFMYHSGDTDAFDYCSEEIWKSKNKA